MVALDFDVVPLSLHATLFPQPEVSIEELLAFKLPSTCQMKLVASPQRLVLRTFLLRLSTMLLSMLLLMTQLVDGGKEFDVEMCCIVGSGGMTIKTRE